MELQTNELVKNNPALRLILGLCPALAVSTVAFHSLVIGLLTTFVLIASNTVLCLISKHTPNTIRVPVYITLLAGFVSMAEMCLNAYQFQLSQSLGIFLPMILVNCLILGNADSQPLSKALLDALIMGGGFTVSLTILGIFREIIGSGTCFGHRILPESVEPFTMITSASGGFLIFGLLLGLVTAITAKKITTEKT